MCDEECFNTVITQGSVKVAHIYLTYYNSKTLEIYSFFLWLSRLNIERLKYVGCSSK